MSNLSEDLVEEILSRVPATSLKRLRSPCKRWNALFKDERFAKKHFGNAPRELETLVLMNYRVYAVNVDPSLVFKGGLGLNNNLEQIKISKILHCCDGLLLCTTKDNRLVVWNPCNGQTRWIKPKNGHVGGWYALGYYENNKSCRSYKILRYWDNHNRMGRVFECEIYEFSSDSWKDILDGVNFNFYKRQNGVSLKGNTYLLAFDANGDFLLGFEYSTERFRRMCLPFERYSSDTLALSVVIEEQLLVLHQSIVTSKLDIWVTNNDKTDQNKGLSWSKFLAVDLYEVQWFSCNVSFFINEEKKMAVCCDVGTRGNTVYIIGDDHGYKEIPIGGSPIISHRPSIISYVPSLVQIQRGTVISSGNRKQGN